MKEFLRPTKATWLILLITLALNISLPFIWLFFGGGNLPVFFDYISLSFPLFQIFGLQWAFLDLGVDVSSSKCNELGCDPNMFGWFLVALSTVFWLFVHYVLASLISKKIIKSGRKDFSN
ncbi:MAG: hypothetical protein A2928_01655 [Candidatus Taylorbacteria bacterium RIFCSPLOWO2_01_FULL_45_15b]|uniref:Uncharacterized protein n=1 Tax=Candidatus Taylorbacteria bacterium RIFCSPLOWO2_01_FULL_45_15b TaxID=1802319 RepID=A0A1G2NB55_9BACT|nr:MAG: hypothetical protein A2928_01655 [Candidatus Taylorbacteria bacterium RIFCSPLOWO2_01_FULL_45_15b]